MVRAGLNIQSIRENIKKALDGRYTQGEISAITEVLLAHRTGLPRHEIGLKRNEPLEPGDLEWFARAISRLGNDCPVQYITGTAEFMGMKLRIRPGVLIPRPETEELVDWVVRDNQADEPSILDIGSGSGCIALALKKLIPGSSVTGLDNSHTALALSRENAEHLGLDVAFIENISILKVTDFFSIIISNPPYIPENDKDSVGPNVLKHEPHAALFVPAGDPLVHYRMIAGVGRDHLVDGGLIYVELYERLAEETAGFFSSEGYADIELRKDINGKYRMLKCRKP